MLKIQTFLQKNFTNYLCSEWLLVNEKVILILSLNKNQQKVRHINSL